MHRRTSRRRALQATMGGALLALTGAVPWQSARAEGAAAAADDDPRFVFVILRGGMDALAVVPPVGDPDYARVRAPLIAAAVAPVPSIAGQAAAALLPLDGFFALHPLLPSLHEMYRAGDLLVAHAICSPYRERSHFDAQNVLEAGTQRPFTASDGWLNRALAHASPVSASGAANRNGGSSGRMGAVAIGAGIPLALRGPAAVTSWAPSVLPAPDADLIARIAALYANDPALARALTDARAVHEGDAVARGAGQFPALMAAAARFLAMPDGPRVAVLEQQGWDTHAAEAQPAGALARNLRQLDAGMAALASGLGEAWSRSVVVLASEFGRTVAVNGTAGTDHGTGGAVFVAGGAVRGGRVLADWPGLAVAARHEGRDLATTLELHALLKGLLHDHLRVPAAALDGAVFPGAAHVQPVLDLVG